MTTNAIQELKVRSEILHKKIRAGDLAALARLRSLREWRSASREQLLDAAVRVKRRDCLTVIALELGFPNWPAAKTALEGSERATEFGTLLYPKRVGGHTNHWFVQHEEAARVHETRPAEAPAYLLAYKHQYFLADRYFIESIGLDPDDDDWRAMGYDWARPKDAGARGRMYARLIAQLPQEGGHE